MQTQSFKMFRLPVKAVFCALVISSVLLLYSLCAAEWSLGLLASSSGSISDTVHPIQRLFEENSKLFAEKLAHQSQTLEGAVSEYKQRYGRAPPPGFSQWFSIAQENDFQFIDEFDVVMSSIEPYWGIDSETLRSRIESVRSSRSILDINITSSGVFRGFDHYHGDIISQWMDFEAWGDVMPTVDLMINVYDEPRIVIPYDAMDQTMAAAHTTRTVHRHRWHSLHVNLLTKFKNVIKWISVGEQPAWEAIDTACRIGSPARSGKTNRDHTTFTRLPFVTNITQSMDVCDSADLLHGHGMLNAPTNLVFSHNLVPIFSQCKLSIFNDILYPSPYYETTMNDFEADEKEDIPWDEKLNRLYWSGSSTGGFATKNEWMNLHRQRMALTVDRDSKQPVQLLRKNLQARWEEYTSTWSTLADLIYYKITHIVQSTEDARKQMEEHFNNAEEPRQAVFKNKYALDIDGNSFSGRYYRLLKSNACVLKQTSLQEWHDGRLVPWVHFIPISPGGEELGEVMRYLTQEEDGMNIGKTIAANGKEWSRRTLRSQDLQLVFMRILLEYARLISDDRELHS